VPPEKSRAAGDQDRSRIQVAGIRGQDD
jgi:hypothetical protein